MTDGEQRRTYPHGVPCWVDTEQPDPEAASRFYGGLFGWTFQDVMQAAAPGTYLIATLDGEDAAAIGTGEGMSSWSTFIAVDDVDATAAAIAAAGGTVVSEPHDAGPGGRTATCADPSRVVFKLWEPRRRLGAQVVNVPGAWNFSHLRTGDLTASRTFYSRIFGWELDELPGGAGASIRVPGYGEHLAATIDPGIFERQAAAPPGFADVIGGLQPATPGERPHWHVTFSVANRDESAARAEQLGAIVLSASESPWARTADVRDPQGAELTLSQLVLPA
jgi:uncharacterized protein